MSNQVNLKEREAYAEILEILKYIDEELISKIPKNLIKLFKENCSKDYEFYLDISIPLKENRLKAETLTLLAMLNLNYWCESEEHKKELIAKYNENEQKYQKALKEKYNPEYLFENKSEKIIENYQINKKQSSLVEYKESFLKKIIHKIKNIFGK